MATMDHLTTTTSSAATLVEEVLATTPLVDGHNDLPWALREDPAAAAPGEATSGGSAASPSFAPRPSVAGLDQPRPEFHTDLPRLHEGKVGVQFWSVYVPSSLPEPEAAVATLEQIDVAHRLIARYPEQLRFVRTAEQARAAFADGRIASLLGAEGGHSIASSLGTLRTMAQLGVRYMTLTHNDNVAWADSATDEPAAKGLTGFGRQVVAEMNRVGMLVDISHTSDATQLAAMEASTAPVIYSHSSVRAVCDHPRNASDTALEKLRANGGVLQVTFVPSFVHPGIRPWYQERAAALEGLEGGDREAHAEAWEAGHPRPRVTIDHVVAHVEHAREVAGIEHIGLGGDYDGCPWLPEGLEDVSGYPRLLIALAERGWSRADLAKLAGENVLRVMGAAEDVASDLPGL